MRPKLSVVKFGGELFEKESDLNDFLMAFNAVDYPKILVHGGGIRATELATKLGIQTKMTGGRRITDRESLDVAVMVYAGLVNKTIVAGLQKLGCNALGLSGADANIINAHKRPAGKIDYGLVGDIDEVREETLSHFLRGDLVPVICSLSHDGEGQLLNTNADTIAAEVAAAMAEKYKTTLYYVFGLPGVLESIDDEDSVIERIDPGIYETLKANGTIGNGMLPKLYNSIYALEKGVKEVHIGNNEMLKGIESNHTVISL